MVASEAWKKRCLAFLGRVRRPIRHVVTEAESFVLVLFKPSKFELSMSVNYRSMRWCRFAPVIEANQASGKHGMLLSSVATRTP